MAETTQRTADSTGESAAIEVSGERPYQVIIGRDLTDRLPGLVSGAAQVAVVFSSPLRARARMVERVLTRAGFAVLPLEIPDAEAGKTIEVAARCWDTLGSAQFTRSDAVVGVGGGAVTDLAGYVAASWLRGVRVVQLPTSLLGMVDAAVGGKTGVNTAAGKNLVGAFHPPAGVLCDLDALETLPHADLRSGMAEVVKAGFIADPVILDLIEGDPAGALLPASPVFCDLVTRAIQVKADVVRVDLRESGLREILNYGHTLGHAIEKIERYTWRHGDAIAVGLVFAGVLSGMTRGLDAHVVARHRTVLESLGLPVRYQHADAWPSLAGAMRVDKKARGSVLRFVALDGLARPVIVADPDPEVLLAAYKEISA